MQQGNYHHQTRQTYCAAVVELLFIISLVLNACQSQEIIEEIRDGVIYVSNPYTGLWQNRQNPPIRFELEQIFGVENEPEETILSGIAGVVADKAGNIYVLDRQDNRLVSFYPDGSVRWSTGRKGQGPGEFERPHGLVWDGDTKLFISNQSLACVLRLKPATDSG